MSDPAAAPEGTTEVIETLPSEWVNSLPAELKDAPFLRPNKDGTIRPVTEVLSALENAAKLQGNLSESHIKIPSPDAGDDDKKAARDRILALWPDLREVTEGEDTLPPEEVAGYKLPEGSEVLDTTMVQDIGQFAIDHKWGQKQFTDYAAKMIEAQTTSTENATQWQKDQSAKLTEKLGAAKEEHLGRVASALEQAGATDDYVAAIKAGKVDAELVMVMDNLVGKMIDMGDEGSQFVQQVKTDARPMTPQEHRDRIWELRASLKDVQKNDPLYKRTTNKIQEHMTLALK
jgi:hypothetical protein